MGITKTDFMQGMQCRKMLWLDKHKPRLKVIPPEVHDQFIRDVAFQYYIVSRCRVKIGRIYIVTHGEDEDNPFVPNDVTEQAKAYAKWVNDNIWDLNRMQKEPEEIQVEIGDQCCEPYECWYYGYCHGENCISEDGMEIENI